MKTIYFIITLSLLFGLLVIRCDSPTQEKTKSTTPTKPIVVKKKVVIDLDNKGIGPIDSLVLGELDMKMAEEGKVLFEEYNCSHCHKTEEKHIGPPMANVMDRRSPEWVMNMILNPDEMTKKDPIAHQLLIDYNGAAMGVQNINEKDTRIILEYLRTL
ncbi:MAG: cytochrome c [Cyclobacteriaceae bacterium]